MSDPKPEPWAVEAESFDVGDYVRRVYDRTDDYELRCDAVRVKAEIERLRSGLAAAQQEMERLREAYEDINETLLAEIAENKILFDECGLLTEDDFGYDTSTEAVIRKVKAIKAERDEAHASAVKAWDSYQNLGREWSETEDDLLRVLGIDPDDQSLYPWSAEATQAEVKRIIRERDEARAEVENATKTLHALGEETWVAGFPPGDRAQTLANVRAMGKALAAARAEAERLREALMEMTKLDEVAARIREVLGQ